MRTQRIVVGMILVLLAGPASAEEGFSALAGIPAQAMSDNEMEEVQGKGSGYFGGIYDFRSYGEQFGPIGVNFFGPNSMVTGSATFGATANYALLRQNYPSTFGVMACGISCGALALQSALTFGANQYSTARFDQALWALGINPALAGSGQSAFFNPLNYGPSAAPYGIALASGVTAGAPGAGRYTLGVLNSWGNPTAQSLIPPFAR